MKSLQKLIAMITVIALVGGCQNSTKSRSDEKREQMTMLLLLIAFANEQLGLNGNWTGSSGATNVIAAEKSIARGTRGTWTYTFSSTIIYYQVIEFDNSTKTVYVKSPDEPPLTDCNGNSVHAESGVACYSRNVWTVDASGTTYYCKLVTNKGSLNDAKADPATADDSDPANSGCNGGAWIKLTPF